MRCLDVYFFRFVLVGIFLQLLQSIEDLHLSEVRGFLTIRFTSVTQLYPTLCNPMDCSTPGLPVHYQLLEFTQIHVHQVSDANQPSHPLSSPSPALSLSQHQGLLK